jgi:hypothetical protein
MMDHPADIPVVVNDDDPRHGRSHFNLDMVQEWPASERIQARFSET